MISAIIPTRDRAPELARTLEAIGRRPVGEISQVIVVDNASAQRPAVPARLDNGARVELVCLDENMGAAARNVGAELAGEPWLLMLDDDSSPSGGDLGSTLRAQADDVAAVTMDIHLPAQGRRESGGLPEVPVGCGVVYRRGAFLSAGGYDATFGYYAEEYDLAARLLLAGMRVVFEPTLRVDHRKVESGRDMGLILGRLVRNNGWVMQRYAPEDERRARLDETIARYGRIAHKEGAVEGYARGLAELERTLGAQARTPMPRGLWDRFTGLSAAREAIGRAVARAGFASARVVARGKHDWAVERALREHGVEVREDGEMEVIGTLSPGPMLDEASRRPGAVVAWEVGAGAAVRGGSAA